MYTPSYIDYILIPTAEFLMGSNDDGNDGKDNNDEYRVAAVKDIGFTYLPWKKRAFHTERYVHIAEMTVMMKEERQDGAVQFGRGS